MESPGFVPVPECNEFGPPGQRVTKCEWTPLTAHLVKVGVLHHWLLGWKNWKPWIFRDLSTMAGGANIWILNMESPVAIGCPFSSATKIQISPGGRMHWNWRPNSMIPFQARFRVANFKWWRHYQYLHGRTLGCLVWKYFVGFKKFYLVWPRQGLPGARCLAAHGQNWQNEPTKICMCSVQNICITHDMPKCTTYMCILYIQ